MTKLRNRLKQGTVSALLMWAPVLVWAQSVAETDAAQTEAAAQEDSAGQVDPVLSLESTLVIDQPARIVNGLDPVFTLNPVVPMTQDETDAAFLERMARINDSQGQVNALEAEGGAWYAELAAQLESLGDLYHAQGNVDEAVKSFQRAMQISRINSGLDSIDQVPLVEKLIESHLAQGQWAKADQYQNYLYYVQNKLYGDKDPRMIPVLYNLARWNIRVFNHRYGNAVGLRLTDAYTLFKEATTIVSLHFGDDDERYVSYLKEMASSAYLVSRNQGLIEDAGRPDYRSAQAMFANRMSQIDPINAQGYREGEAALTQVVDHYAEKDDADLQLANARIDLGDWYLLFERRRAAEEQYALAYELLLGLEDGAELLADRFGLAVPLPAFDGAVQELAMHPDFQAMTTDSLRSGYADVRVEVNAYGQVIDVDFLTEETEENSRIFTLLRRKVRATTFRPALENGEMVRSDNNLFRYRYWY